MAHYEIIRKVFADNAEIFARLIQYLHKSMLLPPLTNSVINVKRLDNKKEQGIGFSLGTD